MAELESGMDASLEVVDEGLDGACWIGFGKRYLDYSSSLRSDEVRFAHKILLRFRFRLY